MISGGHRFDPPNHHKIIERRRNSTLSDHVIQPQHFE